jgi:hypothetical protein
VEKLRIDQKDFDTQFRRIQTLHKQLRNVDLLEINDSFSLKMEGVLIRELGVQRNGLSPNILMVFGAVLISMGLAFYFLSSGGTVPISSLPDLGAYAINTSVIKSLFSEYTNISLTINPYYFTIFLIAPTIFLWDQIMKKGLAGKLFLTI